MKALDELKKTIVDFLKKDEDVPFIANSEKSYTTWELAKEIESESEEGLKHLNNLVLLTVDFIKRGKAISSSKPIDYSLTANLIRTVHLAHENYQSTVVLINAKLHLLKFGPTNDPSIVTEKCESYEITSFEHQYLMKLGDHFQELHRALREKYKHLLPKEESPEEYFNRKMKGYSNIPTSWRDEAKPKIINTVNKQVRNLKADDRIIMLVPDEGAKAFKILEIKESTVQGLYDIRIVRDDKSGMIHTPQTFRRDGEYDFFPVIVEPLVVESDVMNVRKQDEPLFDGAELRKAFDEYKRVTDGTHYGASTFLNFLLKRSKGESKPESIEAQLFAEIERVGKIKDGFSEPSRSKVNEALVMAQDAMQSLSYVQKVDALAMLKLITTNSNN